MIKRIARLGNRRRKIIEMHNEPGYGIRLTLDPDTRAEGMPMHPRVRMSRRGARQKVGSLEFEVLVNSHAWLFRSFVDVPLDQLSIWGVKPFIR